MICMEYIEKLPKWMCWILLPVTFLAVPSLAGALFYYSMLIVPIGYMPEHLLVHVLAPLIGGYYGTVATEYISPLKGKIVPMVLLTLVILFLVWSIPYLDDHDKWYWISLVSQITGFIVGIFDLKNAAEVNIK